MIASAQSVETAALCRAQTDRLNADLLDSEALARHLAARGFGEILGEIEHAVDDLRRLISGALRRVVEEDPMAIAVVADVPSVSALVERTVRSGVPPTPQQFSMAIRNIPIHSTAQLMK